MSITLFEQSGMFKMIHSDYTLSQSIKSKIRSKIVQAVLKHPSYHGSFDQLFNQLNPMKTAGFWVQ